SSTVPRYWREKKEFSYSDYSPWLDRYFDLLFCAVFQSGDRTLFAEDASAAPPGTKSRRANEFHTAFSRKPAPRFECAAPRRRTSQRASGDIVSFPSMGRPRGRERSAMAVALP